MRTSLRPGLCPLWLSAALTSLLAAHDGRAAGSTPAPAAHIVATAPRGQVAKSTELQVTFDRPMAALGAAEVRGFRIVTEPALAGRLRWAAPELLAFDPQKLAPATRYTARLEWQGPGPAPVAGLPVAWTFETPGPELEDLAPYGGLLKRQAIVVKLTQPVPVEAARTHIQVTARGQRLEMYDVEGCVPGDVTGPCSTPEMPQIRIDAATKADLRAAFGRGWRASTDEVRPRAAATRFLALRPATRWPILSELTVKLDAGLVGTLGPVPSRGGKLQVPSGADAFYVERWQCPTSGCALGDSLAIHLSADIAVREIAKVRVSPRPDQLLVHVRRWARRKHGSEIAIWARFAAGETYNVTLPANLRDVKGRTLGESTGGRAVTLVYKFPTHPELTVFPGNGVFAFPTPAHAGLQSRFVKTVELRAVPLSGTAAAAALLTDPAKAPALPSVPPTETRPLHIIGPYGWAEDVLDLDQLGGGHRGMLGLEVRPITANGELPKPEVRFLQRTDLAPVAWLAGSRIAVLVLRHSDLAPVAGATVSEIGRDDAAPRVLGRTDAGGWLDADLRSSFGPVISVSDGSGDARYTQVERQGDRAPNVRLWATLERDLLRPGDRVHVAGWAILDDPDAPTGWRWLPAGTPVDLELFDGVGKSAERIHAKLDSMGRLSGELHLPPKPALGHGRVVVGVKEETAHLSLRIEDVRPPSVEMHAVVPDSVIHGQPLPLDVEVKQLSGEPASVSRLAFSSYCHAVRAPSMAIEPGWAIGVEPPRDRSKGREWVRSGPIEDGRWREVESSSRMAAARAPTACRIETIATCLGRDRVGDTQSTFIHPAPAYLTVKQTRSVQQDRRFSIGVRTVDLQARRTSVGPVTLTLARIGKQGGRTEVASCQARPEATKDGTCWLPGQPAGLYAVRGAGRTGVVAPVEMQVVVERPARLYRGHAMESPRGLVLALDSPRKDVAPGDKVTAVIASPTDAPGLLIVERAGIRERHGFVVRGGRAEVELAVKESWFPAVSIAIAAPVRLPGEKTRLERSSQKLTVSDASRTLAVSISAPAVVRPRQRVPLALRVVDGRQQPVAARLAIWAVDVSYLQLTGFKVKAPGAELRPAAHGYASLVDPFSDLLGPFRPLGHDPNLRTREEVLGGLIGNELGDAYGVGGLGLVGSGSGGGGTGEGEVRRRAHLQPVPLFATDVTTGADGTATVELPMPDDLTRFRITALATAPMPDGSPVRLGKAETELAAQQALVLRAATPRLLRPGDRSELGALVRNLSGHDGELEVRAEFKVSPGASPAAAIVSEPTRTTALRSGQETRVLFRVEGRSAGKVDLDLTAILRPAAAGTSVVAETDALRLPLSVEPEPASIDRAAAYLTLAEVGRAALQIRVPERMLPGGGVSVEASASLLAETLDAAEYLVDYPHGCAEQTSGAILGLVASRQLRALGLRAPEVAVERLQARLDRLASMQLPGGGFGYWPGAKDVNPQVSVYATWVLAHARAAGVSVPEALLSGAAKYVAGLVPALQKEGSSDVELAFALATLAAAGHSPPAPAITALHTRREALDVEALADLILAVQRAAPADARLPALVDLLAGRMLQTPGAARVPESPEGASVDPFASPGRTHALATLAMLRARPGHSLGTKLLRGLFDRRKDGRWRNTQENAFALLAATEQAAREASSGQSSLQATLAGRTILDGELRGGSAGLLSAFTPAEKLVPAVAGGEVALGMELRRGGPVYVRAASAWVVAEPQPRAEGIELERRMPATVTEDGSVRCELTVTVRVPLRYVAVTVPIPAGIEAVLDLGGMHRVATGRVAWANHQELWKDRVSIYADSLQPGVYKATLSLRAVTPGEYVLPVATAEAMYEPEIQARTARARVRIDARVP